MSALGVLLVTADIAVADAVASFLRRRGHEVRIASPREARLLRGKFDVTVAEHSRGDEDGFELVRTLRDRGVSGRVVLLAEAPTVEDFRHALALGDVQFLLKPVQLERLLLLVENADAPAPAAPLRDPAEAHPFEFQRTYEPARGTADRCARELGAFAFRCGVGPAGRCRVLTAVGEVLDMALRRPGTRVSVTAFAEPGRRFSVVVQDFGSGGATSAGSTESVDAGGLERARCLADALHVDSFADLGTRVELTFAVWPVRFDGDECIDLSELEWLPPSLARKVLARIEADPEAPFRLSPALAVTIGRLLAGPDPERALAAQLRSGGN